MLIMPFRLVPVSLYGPYQASWCLFSFMKFWAALVSPWLPVIWTTLKEQPVGKAREWQIWRGSNGIPLALSIFSVGIKIESHKVVGSPSDGLIFSSLVVFFQLRNKTTTLFWIQEGDSFMLKIYLYWYLSWGILTMQNSSLLRWKYLHFLQRTRIPKWALPAFCFCKCYLKTRIVRHLLNTCLKLSVWSCSLPVSGRSMNTKLRLC